MSPQRIALLLLLTGLLAGRAAAAEQEQYLRFKSWQAFLDSGESLYTVRCFAPELAKCVRDYETRGFVCILRPSFSVGPFSFLLDGADSLRHAFFWAATYAHAGHGVLGEPVNHSAAKLGRRHSWWPALALNAIPGQQAAAPPQVAGHPCTNEPIDTMTHD